MGKLEKSIAQWGLQRQTVIPQITWKKYSIFLILKSNQQQQLEFSENKTILLRTYGYNWKYPFWFLEYQFSIWDSFALTL